MARTNRSIQSKGAPQLFEEGDKIRLIPVARNGIRPWDTEPMAGEIKSYHRMTDNPFWGPRYLIMTEKSENQYHVVSRKGDIVARFPSLDDFRIEKAD
jgi:hypothetical protein